MYNTHGTYRRHGTGLVRDRRHRARVCVCVSYTPPLLVNPLSQTQQLSLFLSIILDLSRSRSPFPFTTHSIKPPPYTPPNLPAENGHTHQITQTTRLTTSVVGYARRYNSLPKTLRARNGTSVVILFVHTIQ